MTTHQLQLPPLPILPLQEVVGFRRIGGFTERGIPVELFTAAVRDIAEQDGLSQRATVVKVAGGGATGLDRVDPFAMMAERGGNGWFGRYKLREFVLREQFVPAVVGHERALFSLKENPGVIVADKALARQIRALDPVIPGQVHGRQTGPL